MRQSYKTGLLWLILIVVFITIYRLFPGTGRPGEEIVFSEFYQLIGQDKVAELVVEGDQIRGKRRDNSDFVVVGPIGEDLQKQLMERATPDKAANREGFTFRYMPKEEGSFLQSVVITWLPMIV